MAFGGVTISNFPRTNLYVQGEFAGLLAFGTGRRRHDLDDGFESRGLRAALRIEKSLRPAPRIVLDRHAWRERHRFFPEAPDVEHVNGGHFEHELAALFQRRPVV